MGIKSRNRLSMHNLLKYNKLLFPVYILAKKILLFMTNKRFSDEKILKRMFKQYQGYELDLENPKTLNEKLQWLKIYDHKDYYTTYADKYAAREFIKDTFGEEYLIPLVFHTIDYRELRPENLPDYSVVIKTNHGFGNTVIIRDKNKIDWKKLRMDYKRWLSQNYYYFEREWQYKNIKPRIIVEKMLLNQNGKIPNDYKLNFIEGTNKRNIYNPEWKPIHFTWARKGKDLSKLRGEEIQPPSALPKMIEFGSVVAKLYKYVRVDFYDLDGLLYFGEITQCHGGGFDRILPYEYDLKYGKKMHLVNNV
jgi:hypothetical protein